MSSRSNNHEVRRQARIFLRIASAVFLASLLLWSGTLAYDISRSLGGDADGTGFGRSGRSKNGTKVLSVDALLTSDAKEKIDYSGLIKGLPSTLDNWVVQGPQPVPGADGSVVEGVYTPKDDEMALVSPLVVYVQLQKSPSDAEAAEVVRRKASQYPSGGSRILLDGQEFVVGYSEDSRSHFMGMTDGKLSIWMDASYSQVIPAAKPRVKLKEASGIVAREVLVTLKKARGSL